MISPVISAEDGSQHTEWLQKTDIALGRLPHNDVVLLVLVDLRSRNGTYVNGRRLTAPLLVRETDQIFIGTCRIEVVPYNASSAHDDDTQEVDVVELRLLANVAMHEPGAARSTPMARRARRSVCAPSRAPPGSRGLRDRARARSSRPAARARGAARAAVADKASAPGDPGLPDQRLPWRLGRPDQHAGPEVRTCGRCASGCSIASTAGRIRDHADARDPIVVDLVCRQPPDDEPLAWQPGRCGADPEVDD